MTDFQTVNGKLAKYSSVGCYPYFYLDGWGTLLCADCAQANLDWPDKKNHPAVCDVNWEDPDLYCDECGERIESAYADED